MDELGVEVSKGEMSRRELSKLLTKTSYLSKDIGNRSQNNFQREIDQRIDTMIFRLNHNCNVNKIINSIERQSELSYKEARRQDKLKKDTVKKSDHIA